MKRLATFTLLLIVMLGACHDPACMEHTHCEDTVVSQAESPDGKYVATGYHRSCAGGSGRSTCVKIEEAPKFFWSSRGEPGYVMTIREFHPISAVWKDSTHLEVSSPGLKGRGADELTSDPPATSWRGIAISYR